MADNVTPNDIIAALSTVLTPVENIGVVVSESRFAQSDAELAKMLQRQADDGVLRGVMIGFAGIVSQTPDGTTTVAIVYKFSLKFFLRYLNDSPGDQSSETDFADMIYKANAALDADPYMGITERTARHQYLISSDDIGFGTMGDNAASMLFHAGTFDLNVQVIHSIC